MFFAEKYIIVWFGLVCGSIFIGELHQGKQKNMGPDLHVCSMEQRCSCRGDPFALLNGGTLWHGMLDKDCWTSLLSNCFPFQPNNISSVFVRPHSKQVGRILFRFPRRGCTGTWRNCDWKNLGNLNSKPIIRHWTLSKTCSHQNQVMHPCSRSGSHKNYQWNSVPTLGWSSSARPLLFPNITVELCLFVLMTSNVLIDAYWRDSNSSMTNAPEWWKQMYPRILQLSARSHLFGWKTTAGRRWGLPAANMIGMVQEPLFFYWHAQYFEWLIGRQLQYFSCRFLKRSSKKWPPLWKWLAAKTFFHLSAYHTYLGLTYLNPNS